MNFIRKINGTTKTVRVRLLLAQDRGATLEEITAETGWQPHSFRAYLNGVRQSGHAVSKIERTDGSKAWRIASQAEAKA